MNPIQLLPKAVEIAARAHGATIGKDGSPYLLHPLRMMMKAETYEEKIVAVLHDTIEDTDLTVDDLVANGFSTEIITALLSVTKQNSESYDEFVQRAGENPIGAKVKLLDLYDNVDVTRLDVLGEKELMRLAKYHRAIQYLVKIIQSRESSNGPNAARSLVCSKSC